MAWAVTPGLDRGICSLRMIWFHYTFHFAVDFKVNISADAW
jgi:hypothetical protein